MNLSLFLLTILGVILIAVLISRKARLSYSLQLASIFLSVMLLGLAISSLSYAGSTNAILVLESARTPMAEQAFGRLHSQLNPALMFGYINLAVGSLLFALGFAKSRTGASD